MSLAYINNSLKQTAEEKPLLFFIDDDENIFNLIRAALDEQFVVMTFTDPLECLEKAQQFQPRLIITDLNMPNIDGIEVLGRLVSHPSTNDIPVICTSSNDSFGLRESIINSGGLGLLKKPYNIKTLASSLLSFIENINQKVESIDRRFIGHINYNTEEKYRLMGHCIDESLLSHQKVILLSWLKGEDFGRSKYESAINSEQLIHLEIKSSLITKIPYMNDLSPIFADLKKLANCENLNQVKLIFDEPRGLFDYNDSTRAISTTIQLAKIIKTTFNCAEFFNTRLQDPGKAKMLLKISKILIGRTY